MDVAAYVLGQFAGGALGLAILTALWWTLLRPLMAPLAVLVAANILSLVTATVIATYGLADGGNPNFAFALGRYMVPQFVVLAAMLLRPRAAGQAMYAAAALAHGRDPQTARAAAFTDSAEPVARPVVGNLVRRNFLIRHWRGELSLGVSYWAINVLTNLAVLAVAALLTALVRPEVGFEPPRIFYATAFLWLAIALVVAWQIVGLWRSARRHARERHRLGKSAFWAAAAQVMAVLGLLQLVGTFAQSGGPQVAEMYRIAFKGDPDIPPNELKLLAGGTELSLYGGIKYGLAADVERLLKAAPEVRVIHLTSGGGRVAEAHKLSRLISAHRLETYVSNECLSACTLVFAAGGRRWLMDAARLGYHGVSVAGFDEDERRSASNEWAVAYRETGLAASFVRKALAVSPDDMWYPTIQELLDANAVTDVDPGDHFAVSGHEIAPPLASVEKEMRAASGLVDALHDKDPDIARQIYALTRKGLIGGRSNAAMKDEINALIMPVVRSNLARSDDDTLLRYAALIVEQYKALLTRDVALCFQYAALGSSSDLITALPADLVKTELELNERALRTATERAPLDVEAAGAAWRLVAEQMTSGEVDLLNMAPAEVPRSSYAQYCQASITMLKAISVLEKDQATMLMREILSAY
jgi:hypothetical protein